MTRYVGQADQANGVTALLGGGLRGLGNNLDTVVPVVTTLGIALGVGFVVRAAAAGVAATGASTAMGVMAASARTAGVAISSAFGGPVGLAITGLAVLLTGVVSTSSDVSNALQGTAQAAEKFGIKLSEASKAALKANGETVGVGTSASASEPKIWSFSSAVGGLTKNLWEQAKAARAARLEMLQTQLTEAKGRVATGKSATWAGSRKDSEDSWSLLGQGDISGGLSLGWKSLKSDTANLLSGGRTGREGAAVVADGAKVISAIQAQIKTLLSKPIGKGDLPTGDGAPVATNKNKGKHDGPDREERAAEQRAKREKEFWATLTGQAETAERLPLAAEDYKKQLELQKILGRDLNQLEINRIASLMQQERAGKFINAALEQHNETTRDIASQEEQLRLRISGMTEDQLALEKKIAAFRSNALKQGVDLQSDAFKASEAQYRADEARLGVLDLQNRKLDEQAAKLKDMARDGFNFGKDALATHGSIGDRQAAAKVDYDKVLAQLKAARDSKDPESRLSAAQFQAGVKKAGEDFRQTMAEIGTAFSQRMGRVADFLSNVGNMIGGKLGEIFGEGGKLAGSIGDFRNTKDDISDQFEKAFGNNSPFLKGIGKAVGGAMAGLQIGESIAGIGKLFGANQGFQTGSKIGGTLGGLTGNPLIAAGASILGGLFGSLFSSAPKGKAILTGAGQSVISGNKGSVRDQLTGTANSIQTGLANIAAQLGGTVGAFNVSIGKYKDSFRVSSTGSSNVDGKKTSRISGLLYDGKDEAQAIAIAIKDAISDGAITGIAPIIQKALQGLGADAAIQFAKDWTAAMDDYKALTDPVGAAVDSIIKPLDNLKKTMLQVGASSEDMAKFEDYRAKKLQAALKEQVSGFQSLLDNLNGDGGGVTALTQLTQNLAKLDSFKADLAAGKAVDQDAFTALADKIMSGAGNVYGTNTSEFQDIIGTLKGLTTGAITNATTAFNAAAGSNSTTKAITDQTNAVTATIGISNDYLRTIANAVTSGALTQNQGAALSASATNSKDGRLIQAF